jgi:Ca-activated chloride channel homolog
MPVVPDGFVAPERLFLLIGVGVLAVVYIVMQARRQRYAMRFTNLEMLDKIAPAVPRWRRHLPAFAFLLGVSALVVGIARPVQATKIPSEQATIVLAIDTSLSMQATDVAPSRLEGAKEAAVAFIEDLPDNIQLGLVSFNGVARVRVSPSHNHAASIAAIRSLELGPATAIGEAIFAGLDAIDQLADQIGSPPPARIVLMSDGETTVGRSDDDAIVAAQEAAIPVSTIAFGTDRGVIQLPDDSTAVRVPVNEDKLRDIAENTGGAFYAAASTDELASVYENIGSQINLETIDDEITPSYIAMGLIALTLAGMLSLLWFSRLP